MGSPLGGLLWRILQCEALREVKFAAPLLLERSGVHNAKDQIMWSPIEQSYPSPLDTMIRARLATAVSGTRSSVGEGAALSRQQWPVRVAPVPWLCADVADAKTALVCEPGPW